MSDFTHNPAIIPPGAMPSPLDPPVKSPAVGAPNGPSFGEVLRDTQGVQFSGHAIQRVQRSGVEMGETTISRLRAGVARACGKGARESVFFLHHRAWGV